MKNIHILPTDKPSRLIHYLRDNSWDLFSNSMPKVKNVECKNIYITNNEEIKEGDWKLCLNDNSISKYMSKSSIESDTLCKNCKKIILITDQDLIKDGVQPISDDFLEWFVKNPSCDRVEVEKFNGFAEDYLIIIPKEEPKEINNTQHLKELDWSEFKNPPKEESKQNFERGIIITHVGRQETLEEATERIIKSKVGLHYFGNENSLENLAKKEYIAEGAKWQQEQDAKEIKLLREELEYEKRNKINKL